MTFAEQYLFINLGKRIEEGGKLVASGFSLHQRLYKAEKGAN
jgi:hypothetical protein